MKKKNKFEIMMIYLAEQFLISAHENVHLAPFSRNAHVAQTVLTLRIDNITRSPPSGGTRRNVRH